MRRASMRRERSVVPARVHGTVRRVPLAWLVQIVQLARVTQAVLVGRAAPVELAP